ncbi:MAG: glycosyltransferase family 4 protein [Candidatus Hydrogenedentes bacterium]|nr:glycosyltransferase family 4 protein [Candidatus Hydrogenedentota bacterium]
MKILLTDPHLKGGGQVRYVENLAQRLVAMGHEVVIGCKPGSVLVERARIAKCRSRDQFAFRGGLRPVVWWRDLRESMQFLREFNPDVIHVSGSQDHWTLALANRMMGRPYCLVRTRHNTYPVHDGISNRILNRDWTDYQIVVCDVVRQTLARQRAFDAARMCSIHNGVDAALYAPDAASRARVRREFGYADDHIVCGIAARLTPAKGHSFLLRACAALAPDFPQIRVLILGQGEKEGELKRLAAETGISAVTTFAGFRDDMQACVQALDIGVQPSIDCDTSSFSLKEQMAAQKPVVASDYGGLTEIVTDGEEGLVVPAGTVDPLVRALRNLIEDPDRRAAMGAAGRARVLREFTVDVFASRTVEAYHRAMTIHTARQHT